MLYLPWVTSSIFFVFVEFTLLSCLFYSFFNPELALETFTGEKHARKNVYYSSSL
ncbi:MAG: hypothetical protein LBV62_01495 [Rickettsiales bacterium]|nr:hypothetical protein [Rickettsiales bacterium]